MAKQTWPEDQIASKHRQITDVAIAANIKAKLKSSEKLSRYQDLVK